MNCKEYFNSVADKWDSMCSHDPSKIEKILDITGISGGSRILDVGSGTGILIPYLHARTGKSGRIIAVDIAEKMIEIAKGKYGYENVEFIVGDILEEPFENENSDIIICYSVFPHIYDKQAAIAKMAGLLSKEGKLVICHSESRDAINSLHRNSDAAAVSKDRLPDMQTIEKLFENAGLEPILSIDTEEMFAAIAQKPGEKG